MSIKCAIFGHKWEEKSRGEVEITRIYFGMSADPCNELLIIKTCSVCGKEEAHIHSTIYKEKVNIEYAKNLLK